MFAFKYVIQLEMEGPEIMDKIAWTKELLYTFYDLYIKAIDIRISTKTKYLFQQS